MERLSIHTLAIPMMFRLSACLGDVARTVLLFAWGVCWSFTINAQSISHTSSSAPSASSGLPGSAADDDSKIKRGKYLVDLGNCYSCHTRAGGEPFTGGVPFETPVGVIYSTNITPDKATGIGTWTPANLRRAMHEGIAADGRRLFPAFPYTSYTKVTDVDVDAIYAYLRTVQPAVYHPPANSLIFGQRWGMAIWNALFFKEGRFLPTPSKSAEWNRGAYLVEGLGHCSACHSPRGLLMAEDADKPLWGGVIEHPVTDTKLRRWSAVNLTSAKHGLASWSQNDLAKYLQTGFSMRGGAFGPMTEVILNSLKHLSREDAQSMALYLKSLPGEEYRGETVSPELAQAGAEIYEERCSKCHSASGRGGFFTGPPLAGSAIVQAEDPSSLINIILYGPDMSEEISFGKWETMKSYGEVLNDDELAKLTNYLRGSWGNRGRPITIDEVARQR